MLQCVTVSTISIRSACRRLLGCFAAASGTVEVLAAAGKLGARRVEDDIDYFQIYMAEQYFDRFVPIAERKAVCRQIK